MLTALAGYLRYLLLLALMFSISACEPPETTSTPPIDVSADLIRRPQPALPARDIGDQDQFVGQTVYVPVYSQVQTLAATRAYALTANVLIRNTDAERGIRLVSARYYNNGGELISEFVDSDVALPPLGSKALLVEQLDRLGGIGANFILDWRADGPVSEPVIEAVMIGEAGTQGVAFVSPGRVTRRYPAASGDSGAP